MIKLSKVSIVAACAAVFLTGCGQVFEASEMEQAVVENVPEDTKEPEDEVEQQKALQPIVEAGIDYLSTEGIMLEPKTQIAMVSADKGNYFYSRVRDGAAQAIADLNQAHGYTGKSKITLLYDGPRKENVVDQINIIDQFLDKAPDAMSIAFTDATACKTQMQMMRNNGIKLISFDAPDDSQMAEALISTDNKMAAAQAAAKFFDSVEDSSKIAVLVHNSEKQTGKDRYRAITGEYLANYEKKGIRFVDIIYMNQQGNDKAEALEELWEEHPDLAGIICTDLKFTEIVIDYVKEKQMSDFAVVGFDASEKIINAVKDGTIVGTVSQDPYGMGYATVIAAARSVAGMGNAQNIHSSYIWIDGENVDNEETQWVLAE